MFTLNVSVHDCRPQRIGGLGTEGAAFGFSGMDPHSAARSYQPGTPNSFAPVGGNPFG